MKMMFLVLTMVLYISTAVATSTNNEQPNKGIGNICEKDNPCENGATCGYTHGGYICKCPIGWDGDDCNKEIDECAKSPCGVGTCKNTDGSYTCICPSGFSGAYCEKEIDECLETNPCAPSNICVNTPGSYVCFCSGSLKEPNCKAACTAAGYTDDPTLGCYRMDTFHTTYQNAREECASDGGHLLLVTSAEMANKIDLLYEDTQIVSVWIQGSRNSPTSPWVTDDGKPLPLMERLVPTQDSNATALMYYRGNSKFFPQDSSDRNGFICAI